MVYWMYERTNGAHGKQAISSEVIAGFVRPVGPVGQKEPAVSYGRDGDGHRGVVPGSRHRRNKIGPAAAPNHQRRNVDGAGSVEIF